MSDGLFQNSTLLVPTTTAVPLTLPTVTTTTTTTTRQQRRRQPLSQPVEAEPHSVRTCSGNNNFKKLSLAILFICSSVYRAKK